MENGPKQYCQKIFSEPYENRKIFYCKIEKNFAKTMGDVFTKTSAAAKLNNNIYKMPHPERAMRRQAERRS